jgi:hypothetical protein
MTARADANPYVPVRGRDGEAANAGQQRAFADSLTVGVEVVEAAPIALTRDAGVSIGRKEESFGCNGFEGQRLGLRGGERLFGFGGLFEQLSAFLQGVRGHGAGSVGLV